MLELFFNGSRLFMGIISIAGVIMLILSVINVKGVLSKSRGQESLKNIKRIREIGLFALIVGVLASIIDLMGLFQAIEMAGEASISILGAGLKLTFITTLYGLIIYALSLLITMGLRWGVSKSLS